MTTTIHERQAVEGTELPDLHQTPAFTTGRLADLGLRLMRDGASAYESDLRALANAVRSRRPGVAQALADPHSSEVARLRAYSLAATQLGR